MRKALVAAFAIAAATSARPLAAADWPCFRGPASNGTAEGEAPPAAWTDASGVAWKVDLPGRGPSSPIVVAGRVFVTSSSGYRKDRLHILGIEAASGRTVWERQLWATGSTLCHPKTSMAAPTPASDGKRIFASFSTHDVVCTDLDGNVLWLRGLTSDYPNAFCGTGMASSPLLAGGVLVLQVENQSDSFAVGLDAETGVNVWRIRRPSKPSWSTPVLLRAPGAADVVVLEGWEGVSGHDPATGRELWAHAAGMNCIPSPTVFEGNVLVPCDGLTALRPRPGGAPEVVWQSAKARPATASPLVLGGRVYVLSSAGILTCADATRGDVAWQLRLEGPFSASPVAAGGRIYCINEGGLAQVVKPGDAGAEIVGKSALGETVLATPALAGGALYVRTDARLWKIAGSEGPAARAETAGDRPF